MNKVRPFVILDRDGVINFDSHGYIKSLAEWYPIPGSLEAIVRLNKAGFSVAVVTNQSGLGRQYFTKDTLTAIHQHMCKAVEKLGGKIEAIFYCPHLPTAGCDCRKPNTRLLQEAAAQCETNLENAFLIGDSWTDMQAAQSVGCHPILVKTGNGATVITNDDHDLSGITICENLSHAVEWILSR